MVQWSGPRPGRGHRLPPWPRPRLDDGGRTTSVALTRTQLLWLLEALAADGRSVAEGGQRPENVESGSVQTPEGLHATLVAALDELTERGVTGGG